MRSIRTYNNRRRSKLRKAERIRKVSVVRSDIGFLDFSEWKELTATYVGQFNVVCHPTDPAAGLVNLPYPIAVTGMSDSDTAPSIIAHSLSEPGHHVPFVFNHMEISQDEVRERDQVRRTRAIIRMTSQSMYGMTKHPYKVGG